MIHHPLRPAENSRLRSTIGNHRSVAITCGAPLLRNSIRRCLVEVDVAILEALMFATTFFISYDMQVLDVDTALKHPIFSSHIVIASGYFWSGTYPPDEPPQQKQVLAEPGPLDCIYRQAVMYVSYNFAAREPDGLLSPHYPNVERLYQLHLVKKHMNSTRNEVTKMSEFFPGFLVVWSHPTKPPGISTVFLWTHVWTPNISMNIHVLVAEVRNIWKDLSESSNWFSRPKILCWEMASCTRWHTWANGVPNGSSTSFGLGVGTCSVQTGPKKC